MKMDHHARKIKVIAVVIIALLIYFSFMNIFSSNKVDLSSPKSIVQGIYYYFGWIGKTAGNLWDIGVSTTHTIGNAIKLNANQTNSKV